MFRLFKKKYAYPEVKCPRNAREMTDEEMLLVNGGSERRENSHEGVVNANVGDTIERKDGTVVTLNQGDIDYAKNQLGISDSGSGTSVSGFVGGSGSNGNTPSSPSSPSSPYSPSSPSSTSSLSSTNKTTDATSNILQGSEHHSAYDQQYINEMMEKEQKNALSGSGIQGNAVSGKRIEGQEIKVNPGAGNMTVSDYIALQKKMGAGATVSGEKIGGKAVIGTKIPTQQVRDLKYVYIPSEGVGDGNALVQTTYYSDENGKLNVSTSSSYSDRFNRESVSECEYFGNVTLLKDGKEVEKKPIIRPDCDIVYDSRFDYIGTATFDYPIDSYSNYSIKSDIDLVVNRFPWKMKIEHEVNR